MMNQQIKYDYYCMLDKPGIAWKSLDVLIFTEIYHKTSQKHIYHKNKPKMPNILPIMALLAN